MSFFRYLLAVNKYIWCLIPVVTIKAAYSAENLIEIKAWM